MSKSIRKHIRFRPDPLAYAEVSSKVDSENFEPEFVGLIIEEAPLGGCSIIALDHKKLEQSKACTIKVGELKPLVATVMWCREMEPGILRYGFRFEE